MAMVVKNNMSAVRTLNTLNKNSSALQKSLSKVSSGMKINSAQDDASGYAISERMRVQIRSLDQANQNTQNGSSMMKTAEGAVSSTVEILKSLKEKAINAANDTNTDSDRTTIQKEIDQFIDQIDDNALTTFNGKYLVDGSKNNAHNDTYATFTNQSLAKGTTGTTYLAENNTAGEKGLANRIGESLEIDSTDYVTASYVKDGATHTTTFKVEDNTLQDIFDKLNQQANADANVTTGAEVFGKKQMPTVQSAPEPTAAEIVAGLSDKDLADIAKNGSASSKLDSDGKIAAALKELSTTSGAAVDTAAATLAGEVAAVTVDTANLNTGIQVSFTASDGATNISTTFAKNTTGNALSGDDDETPARKFSDAIAAEAAAWAAKEAATGTTTNDDMAQTVAANLNVQVGANITEGSPAIGDVINANNKSFHELTRAALVDAAAQQFKEITVGKTALTDAGDLSDSASSDAYVGAANGMKGFDGTDATTDAALAAVLTDLGTNADKSAGKTGVELLATLQEDLANSTVTDAVVAGAADATTGNNTIDTAKHVVDGIAALYHASQGGGGATVTDNELVHSGTDIGKNKSGDRVDTADGTEGLTITAANSGVPGQVSGITISISDSDGNVKKAANAALDNFAMSIRAENRTTGGEDANNNLTFQVGAAANQAISVSLTDMRSEALGLKGSDGTKVSVATQDKANAAVAVFDNAISKALDQQTTIGSIEARLEYTSQNLTTSSENVQAAESTIRDADMAKEMTNYTKNNVLLQAAQSMLAQANQSSSAVLSLLQ